MKPQHKKWLISFLAEIALYGALVSAYFLLVLHALGNRLEHLFEHQRTLYAAVSVILVIGQGLALEGLTRWLLGLFRQHPEA